MGSSKHQNLGESAWSLARRQHGVIARRQLLALGMSGQSVQHRVDRGRLHRIDRGIYAVGRPALTRRGQWMVAVLGCGSRAVLSYGSAAALWGFGDEKDGLVDVTVPFPSPRRRPGVLVHRRPNLRPSDVTAREGIPVTTVVRTLIDLATRLDAAALDRAINEADRLELTDPEALFAALDSHPGRR